MLQSVTDYSSVILDCFFSFRLIQWKTLLPLLFHQLLSKQMITKHLLGKCHFSIATHVINYSLHDFPRFIPGHQTFTNSFPLNVLLIQISFRYIHVFKMCCIWSNVNRHFPTILNQDLANGQIMWRSLVWTVLVIFIGIRHRYLFYCKRLADSSSHIPKGIATVP